VFKAKANKLKEHAHWVALLGGVLPALTASIISVMTAYRGEPEANRAYEILAPQVNRQRTALQITLGKLSKIEGRLEGETAAKLAAKLDKLSEENAALKAQIDALKINPKGVKSTSPSTDPQASSVKKCPDGQVLGADGVCHRVRKAIAAQVQADTVRARVTEQKLREKKEWLRREKEKRRQLEQKLRMLKATQQAETTPQLKIVPDSLKK